jgi:acetaldehyde dehydrogenase (acetylating)
LVSLLQLSIILCCGPGLVITEAIYGVSEPDEEAKSLSVDVTIAIQALVHNGQLYIPGHRPKVSNRFRVSIDVSSYA